MLNTIPQILSILAAFNCTSFIMMRLLWGLGGRLATNVVVRRPKDPHRQSSEVVFLAAGILNQPAAAFAFAEPMLKDKTIYYLNFKQIGWSACATACVIADIIEDDKLENVQIYAISASELVACYLRHIQKLGKWPLKFSEVAIDPCPRISAVQSRYRWILTIGTPLFEAACHVIGWLSIIPIIHTPGGRYSLTLLADQLWEIAYNDISLIASPVSDYRAILNLNDEFLDNNFLASYTSGQQIVKVAARHGDTIGFANAYAEGLSNLNSDNIDNKSPD